MIYRNEKVKQWCITQRHQYKKGLLSQERIKKLESIDGWWWSHNNIWFDKGNKLKQHMLDGNEIPNRYHPVFGYWISRQRHQYKNGKLSQEQIDFLESIDGWVWRINLNAMWFNKGNKLKQHMLDGDEFPKQTDPIYGIWILNQRKNYKNGKLSQEQIDLLESIDGWFWIVDLDNIWFDKGNKLKQHMLDGNEIPLRPHPVFGHWIATQRSNYRKGKLSQERIDFLESIDGWMWSRNDMWFDKGNKLKQHMLDGDEFPKQTDPIYSWIRCQRQQYKNGKLSQEQIDFLESIDGWWWKL